MITILNRKSEFSPFVCFIAVIIVLSFNNSVVAIIILSIWQLSVNVVNIVNI
jgi:hypothetical protein